FRHLRASDLDGCSEFPGLSQWLNDLNPEQCALLLLAPPGTGKTAAVGSIARKTGKPVVMCNLVQVLEYPDSPHQLRNLLVAVAADVATAVRPVRYGADVRALKAAIAAADPEVILHTGQGGPDIRVERLAVNVRTGPWSLRRVRRPDCPQRLIVPGAPPAYF